MGQENIQAGDCAVVAQVGLAEVLAQRSIASCDFSNGTQNIQVRRVCKWQGLVFKKSVGAGFPCHPIVAQHVEARLLSTQVSDFNVITYTTLTIIGNLHNLKRPSRQLRSEERAWHFFLHSEEVNNDKIGFMKVFVPCSLCTFKKPLLQIRSVALSALPNPSATVQWNPSH